MRKIFHRTDSSWWRTIGSRRKMCPSGGLWAREHWEALGVRPKRRRDTGEKECNSGKLNSLENLSSSQPWNQMWSHQSFPPPLITAIYSAVCVHACVCFSDYTVLSYSVSIACALYIRIPFIYKWGVQGLRSELLRLTASTCAPSLLTPMAAALVPFHTSNLKFL